MDSTEEEIQRRRDEIQRRIEQAMSVTARPGKRAIIYVRQSEDVPDGIDRQLEKALTVVETRGLALVYPPFRDNDVSASKKRKRPGYEQAMKVIKAKQTDYLIVPEMDRLYRRSIELEHIIPVVEQAKVLVVAATGEFDLSTETGRMVARMLVAAAQGEVEIKGRRQRERNLQHAKEGGRYMPGFRPFGYQKDKITPLDDEAEAVRWAARHILAGGSVSAVTRKWAELGVKPRFEGRTYRDEEGNEVPYSGKWTQPSVTRILTNPHIAGLATLPGSDEIIGDGNWSPIITPETWAAVKEILRDPNRTAPRGAVSLGGFLFYCRCGAKVQRDTRYRGRKADPNRVSIPIYKCVEYTAKATGRPGPHVTIAASQIDAYVEMRILDRMREPDAAAMFERRGETADVPKLKQERKEISEGLTRVAGDEAMGIIPRSIYLDVARRVTARMEEIDALIAEAGKTDAAALLLGADDPKEVWDGLDVTVQRKIVDSLVHITLKPPGCGCRNPDLTQLVRVAWRKG